MRLPRGTVKLNFESDRPPSGGPFEYMFITPYTKGTRLIVYPRSVVVISRAGSLCVIFDEKGDLPVRQAIKLPGMGRVIIMNSQELVSTFYYV
jgi:hypothetical protein